MVLLSLLLAGGVLVGTADDPPPPRPPVTPPAAAVVRIAAGRLTVVQGDEIRVHAKGEPPFRIEGPAYVECGPGADVQVTWRGLSSLRLHGSGALEWEVQASAPQEPIVRVARLTTLDVEVRRGTVHLELPEAWALKVQSAALALRERSGGDIEVRNHGGRTTRIVSRVPRRDPEWPRRVPSGAKVLLPSLPPLPPPADGGD